MATTKIKSAEATTSGSSIKATFSAWVKRSDPNSNAHQDIFNWWYNSDYRFVIRFQTNGTLDIFDYRNGSLILALVTNRVFRDTNAWYNIVFTIDRSLSTADDRIKLYINGVQETSFSARTNPSQQTSGSHTGVSFNASNYRKYLGGRGDSTANYFNGSLSHVHWTDGYAYSSSTFGSTDATTGEWKINTSPSITMGINGFTTLKDGNTITDQSTNNHNFSLDNGTLTKTEDCPSNVFATFNSLIKATTTFSNGNTTGQTQNSNNYLAGMSTLGMPKNTGIYYCEIKLISESASGESCIGVASEEAFTLRDAGTLSVAEADYNWGIRNQGREYYDGGSADNKHGGFSAGDIMGVYFDSTNSRLTFSKNGGWWNGTSSWTGASPDLTNYFVGTAAGNYQTFFFNCGDAGNTANAKWSANFGNGYFGTTAVSSAGTNTSGQVGIFEYNMPSNSKVLSTKGLNL